MLNLQRARSLCLCLALSALTTDRLSADVIWENHLTDEQSIGVGTQVISDGVTLTMTSTVFSDSDGGTFDLTAERSATFNSFEAGTTGNHAGYIEFTFNNENDDPVDYVALQIDFGPAVNNLSFSLLDIDGSSSNSWDDGVEIFIDGVNVRTNSSWYTLGAVVIEDNESYMDGFEAIPQSASFNETTGNIDFDFGTRRVNTITIRYFSTDDAVADPASQFIGLSDMTFSAIPEPQIALPLLLAAVVPLLTRRRRLAAPGLAASQFC